MNMIRRYPPIVQTTGHEDKVENVRLAVDYHASQHSRMTSSRCKTFICKPKREQGSYLISAEFIALEGIYKQIIIQFNKQMNLYFPEEYPNIAPRVFCTSKIYHPNIDCDTGEVALAMLQSGEWISSLNLNLLLFVLELVILEPNMNCLPNNIKNFELVNIYKYQHERFLQLVNENKESGELLVESTSNSENFVEDMTSKMVKVELDYGSKFSDCEIQMESAGCRNEFLIEPVNVMTKNKFRLEDDNIFKNFKKMKMNFN